MIEALRRNDGRIALFEGDEFLGHANLNGANPGKRGPTKKPTAPRKKRGGRRKATVKLATHTAAESAGERGKNTGVSRRCEDCGAITKRTICPNGHRVCPDP